MSAAEAKRKKGKRKLSIANIGPRDKKNSDHNRLNRILHKYGISSRSPALGGDTKRDANDELILSDTSSDVPSSSSSHNGGNSNADDLWTSSDDESSGSGKLEAAAGGTKELPKLSAESLAQLGQDPLDDNLMDLPIDDDDEQTHDFLAQVSHVTEEERLRRCKRHTHRLINLYRVQFRRLEAQLESAYVKFERHRAEELQARAKAKALGGMPKSSTVLAGEVNGHVRKRARTSRRSAGASGGSTYLTSNASSSSHLGGAGVLAPGSVSSSSAAGSSYSSRYLHGDLHRPVRSLPHHNGTFPVPGQCEFMCAPPAEQDASASSASLPSLPTRCTNMTLPMASYCVQHILNDSKQTMYMGCTHRLEPGEERSPNARRVQPGDPDHIASLCDEPVVRSLGPLCARHGPTSNNRARRAQLRTDRKASGDGAGSAEAMERPIYEAKSIPALYYGMLEMIKRIQSKRRKMRRRSIQRLAEQHESGSI